MTYSFHCDSCTKGFDLKLTIEDRDKPLKRKCPNCGVKGKVERVFQPMAVSYDGIKTDLQRAGSGWNDVLKKIDKYAGKRSTVETR